MFQEVMETDENPHPLVEDSATQTSNRWYDGQIDKFYKNTFVTYSTYIEPLFRLEKCRIGIVH